VAGPELSVVCRSCGSEVSPYVTECPYCGNRLRKRAPKLEREGNEIRVHKSRREKRRAARRERVRERPSIDLGGRPIATGVTIGIGALSLVIGRAVGLNLDEIGAIVGPVGSDFWRYLTAPLVYSDVGSFLVLALAIGVFGAAVERRLGTFATATLILASGALGMLAADAASAAGLTDFLVASGGNGIALGLLGAWLMLWLAEARNHYSEPLDEIGVGVCAAVLLLLPLVDPSADALAGLVGGLVGLAMGSVAGRRSRAGAG
jgi:membrane associated rhomboid family serine protease